jgi:hypothetical protein
MNFQMTTTRITGDWLDSIINSHPTLARGVRRARRKNLRPTNGHRYLKRWTWDAADGFPPYVLNNGDNMNDNKIFLGTSDFDDMIVSEVLAERIDNGKSTTLLETTVLATKQKWSDYIIKNYDEDNWLTVQSSSSGGFIIHNETKNYIRYNINSSTLTFKAYGDEEFTKKEVDIIETEFDVVTSYIEWVYNSDGSSVNVPLNHDRLPVEEMYPFLKGESLASYYDRYLASSANILLLIGPPGTGKTTFIRGLLAHSQGSAIVTYDAAILEKDGLFARFIEDDANVMVLEDSDAFLKSRSDGNTMMHRFLNVGDGLVTTKGKKMVFSTNLPSIRDIDSALVRPGRCFDVVTFNELSEDEANVLAKRLGVDNVSGSDKYSIAEIFNKQDNKPKERKVGFI